MARIGLFLLCSFVNIWINSVNSCIIPTGLGTNIGEINPNNVTISPLDLGPLFAANDNVQFHYEAPIDFRSIVHAQNVGYSIAAAYDSNALDFLGRADESEDRRRCNNTLDSTLYMLHRDISIRYATYWAWERSYYSLETMANLDAIFADLGLNPHLCEDPNFNCSDISTPWGLAWVLTEEIYGWARFDGWNADGSYNRDVNRYPYEDWRSNPYRPANNPWNLRRKRKWQPLQESDNLGFIFHQEHVVPHIGFTGKSIYLSRDYRCNLTSPKPRYNYRDEIELLLDRLKNLNDTTKMEIEYFDSKISSLLPLALQFLSRIGEFDTLKFWSVFGYFSNILYEVTMVVWKEKVLHDKVRPTSIVQKLYRDDLITTYAGVDLFGNSQGVDTFLGKDFEPYFRTMPHAEYPSGSACICEAIAQALRLDFGDDIVSVIGGPLIATFDPFTSTKEPLSTPSEPVTFAFSTWTEISERCGESRLNGGMHFSKSVPAGANLCRDIGTLIKEIYDDLLAGVPLDLELDLNDFDLEEDICED